MLPDELVFCEIIPRGPISHRLEYMLNMLISLPGLIMGGRLVLPGLRPISSGTQGKLMVLEDPLARQWPRRGGGPPPDGPHSGSAGIGVS